MKTLLTMTAAFAALLFSGLMPAEAQEASGLNAREIEGGPGDNYGLEDGAHAPALSEDGSRIVYYDDNYRIWTVNVHSGRRTQLTSGYFDLNPAWSPDGEKIAFRRSTVIAGNSYNDIWIMKADGSLQTELTDAAGTGGSYDRPAWAPDGTRIVMEAAVGGMMSEIYIIDLATRTLFNVTAGNTRENNRTSHEAPAWLVDEERITFARNGDFTVIRTDGTDMKQ